MESSNYRITFPGLEGTQVSFQGQTYTLTEAPYCDVRTPSAPLEPRANALAADGSEVEVYWFLYDAEQPISDAAINGILTIEEGFPC